MATVQLTVCDVCEDRDRGTRHYRITSEGRKAEADLCDEHALPLEHLLGDPRELPPAKPTQAKRVSRTGRKPRTTLGAKVTSLEEIEKAKRKS